ncbi:hypothetical protein QO002_002634 [Pararhizobium capsulatum DSM 1112]|uniref:Uncharacterized protein n=1 Tax=Pararhizobium capsulatum DSM 1112 TaxID=1121113 RepID=A0ABU0BS59_9HYPH|nr:hypothetical protein [Pararhizobium capsulatum]MDQ0320496.1 hypothetical protein [Pararhizobium capsulatum DSM 1112]
MKHRTLLPLFFSVAFAAHAFDPLPPVREIMDEAVNGWSENPTEGKDYFDVDRLDRIYSADFAGIYRAASKFPAYDEGDSPFDYDVIVSGQDSCTLNDLKMEPTGETDGTADVRVTFDNTHCLGERDADWKPTELHFMVKQERGHPVIDDITRAAGSVKEELRAIAEQDGQ